MTDTTPTGTQVLDAELQPLAPGSMLVGRYRIDHQLGAGGYGEVLSARDQQTGRQVAIKLLHHEATTNDPSALGRLRQEAEVLRSLDHPNIVSVYDFGDSARGYYLVMELIEGTPLDAAIFHDGPASSDRVLIVVQQLLDALSAVHKLDILHRDIKPENIILVPTSEGERVKLVDFGLAKALDNSTLGDNITLVKTRAGGFLGTPRYTSPEQVVGDPVAPYTDLFGLGLVIAEWLTGQMRLVGDTYGDIMQLLVGPQALDISDVPFIWRDWLRKMLAKDPKQRFQSAAEARAALVEFVEAPLLGSGTVGETREFEFDPELGRFVPVRIDQDLPEESGNFLTFDAPLELDLDTVDRKVHSTPAESLAPINPQAFELHDEPDPTIEESSQPLLPSARLAPQTPMAPPVLEARDLPRRDYKTPAPPNLEAHNNSPSPGQARAGAPEAISGPVPAQAPSSPEPTELKSSASGGPDEGGLTIMTITLVMFISAALVVLALVIFRFFTG